jgi:phosphate transport system permease protein
MSGIDASLVNQMPFSRRAKDVVFKLALYAAIGVAVATLIGLLLRTFLDGQPRLNGDLWQQPSERPKRAGVQSGVFGTLWIVGFVAVASLPLGVGTALYLEEFARQDRWYNRLIELNIQNLAAVPSIVYGILGLAFVARGPISWGFTVGSAGLILTLVVLPTVIIASREAIRAVPSSLRSGSLALGATRWQTIRRQVLPGAVPGIATGSILSVSRAMGETAPLILLGGVTFITKNPNSLDDRYTTLPLLIYNYTSSSKQELRTVAAAAIVVLLIVLLLLNATAILIRNKFQRKW